MAYSLISATGFVGGTGGGTSSAINTTGSDLIVIISARLLGSAPTISDNQSNSWTALTLRSSGSTSDIRIYYKQAPTTNSSHTFTSSGANTYGSLAITAWSGSVASPFDVENGGGASSGTTQATGSVTPSENNELVVTGLCWAVQTSDESINSSFTTPVTYRADGTNIDVTRSYIIQTTATATNPTWSWTTSAEHAVAIATFKALQVPTGFASWASRGIQKPPIHYRKNRVLTYD